QESHRAAAGSIPDRRLASAPFSGRWLALRTEEGGAIHEGGATDQGPAAIARLVLTAVRVQAAVEVAGLPVHVDVEIVETGAALDQRLEHDFTGMTQDLGGLRAGEPVARTFAVQTRAPKRFVGIDVA